MIFKNAILALLIFLLPISTATARTLASITLTDGLHLQYYVSASAGTADTNILIAIHGYTRDATRTYDAASNAASTAGVAANTLIVAPIFQVPGDEAGKCSFHGVPGPAAGDALWHCDGWSDGLLAINGAVSSFQAMDQLISTLLQRYKSVRTITIAGFSAGGQYVQRYAGFAQLSASGMTIHYVVADPSTFVYFDAARPEPNTQTCSGFNNWKYGTDRLPAYFNRSAAAARQAYAAANIQYLEGALDSSAGPGTAYKLLAKNCRAELQGPFRLQRGEFYAAYDKASLSHGAHPITIVPGCGHSVTCVFPSEAARTALFGRY
jgi:hypothetical protein